MFLRISAFVLLVAVIQAASTSKTKFINSHESCGTNNALDNENEFRLTGNGQISSGSGDCSFTFTSGADCKGICYMVNQYSFIKDKAVSVKIGASTVYDAMNDFIHEPMCMENVGDVTVTLTLGTNYVYNDKEPGYKFDINVYSKCSKKGMVTNIDFEEAVSKIDGYHHGEDRENRERKTFVTGILLGFGLASIFLVVLLVGWCYVRNSPNRGSSRSGGMPKVGGFKKKMTPGEEPKSTEMGVRYESKNPDRAEASPLMKDPEKPPVDRSGSDGDDSDDESDLKKKTTEPSAPEPTTEIINETDTDDKKDKPTDTATSGGDVPGDISTTVTSSDHGTGADHSGGVSSSGGADHSSGGGGYSYEPSSGGGGGDYSSGGGGGGGDSGGGCGGSDD